MNIVNLIVKFLLKLTLLSMSAMRILFNYLEKETTRVVKDVISPSPRRWWW